jgi:hypothetical protein
MHTVEAWVRTGTPFDATLNRSTFSARPLLRTRECPDVFVRIRFCTRQVRPERQHGGFKRKRQDSRLGPGMP